MLNNHKDKKGEKRKGQLPIERQRTGYMPKDSETAHENSLRPDIGRQDSSYAAMLHGIRSRCWSQLAEHDNRLYAERF